MRSEPRNAANQQQSRERVNLSVTFAKVKRSGKEELLLLPNNNVMFHAPRKPPLAFGFQNVMMPLFGEARN